MTEQRILDSEILRQRADNLGTLNGLKLVFAELSPATAPDHAKLRLVFHNGNHLAAIVNTIKAKTSKPHEVFAIRGGGRIRAGDRDRQVRVTKVEADSGTSLLLTVEPIGDYSTYTLTAAFDDSAGTPAIDPLLGSLKFKFRPGCFNLDCTSVRTLSRPSAEQPDIDYLARDFLSFKHSLINAMRERVPDWVPTSEADLDQVIIDLLAADADELADFQDRVMNDAYLGSARKRVSLARHARLMDYHIHQGNQASTWLVAEVNADLKLGTGTGVRSGSAWDDEGSEIFVTGRNRTCHPELNALQLYTWGGAVTALERGATEADVALRQPLNATKKADADTLAAILSKPYVTHLVLEQVLNPETGGASGVDRSARQLLQLLEDEKAAEPLYDPLDRKWMVRVRWHQADALKRRCCFVADCTGQPPDEAVSLFRGNLLQASHGRPYRTRLLPPGSEPGLTKADHLQHEDEANYEITRWGGRRGALCTLPNGPLAYRDTPPGGKVAPSTSLQVAVFPNLAVSSGEHWEERNDLIESKDGDTHFLVETDELGVSRIRFGNGANGQQLPEGALVECTYQVGRGSDGNVGRDSLTGFDAEALPKLKSVRNPFDVTNGRDPEPAKEIVRRVPEAYRARQRRAVTLADYEHQAEALPGVSHARARYGWTGSWRTVRVAIDPAGSDELDEALRERVQGQLDALRLIGEDLEVRGARYVGLDILLSLCASQAYWAEDLTAELEMRFSDGYLPTGAPAFFHPDRWTFGQPLRASQIVGAALAVEGVERVLSVSLRRLDAGGGADDAQITVKPEDLPLTEVEQLSLDDFEVIRVANDPSHLEQGRIRFHIQGGRR